MEIKSLHITNRGVVRPALLAALTVKSAQLAAGTTSNVMTALLPELILETNGIRIPVSLYDRIAIDGPVFRIACHILPAFELEEGLLFEDATLVYESDLGRAYLEVEILTGDYDEIARTPYAFARIFSRV